MLHLKEQLKLGQFLSQILTIKSLVNYDSQEKAIGISFCFTFCIPWPWVLIWNQFCIRYPNSKVSKKFSKISQKFSKVFFVSIFYRKIFEWNRAKVGKCSSLLWPFTPSSNSLNSLNLPLIWRYIRFTITSLSTPTIFIEPHNFPLKLRTTNS